MKGFGSTGKWQVLIVACLAFFLSSCLTWYERRAEYNAALERQDFRAATDWLEKSKPGNSRNRLLYCLEAGMVARQSGDLELSNRLLLEAGRRMEDFRKEQGAEALSLISNPMMKPYQAEDAEQVLVHYFLALNFLELQQFESALVECRQLQLRLQTLRDRYGEKVRYSCDGFVLMLSGMIYEAQGEINDAFIAYRNAWECYQDPATTRLGLVPPQSLKTDLLRTARKMGFYDELERYERDFGMRWTPEEFRKSEVVMLVHNGLGPVKAEQSLNFFIAGGAGGVVNFSDESGSMTFPLVLPPSANERSVLGNVHSVRAAIPLYLARDRRYESVRIISNQTEYIPAVGEKVNELLFQSLEDRMAREMGNVLLRLAVKKGIEVALREKDQTLGALAGLAGAIVEKADTRNWQSLPYEIGMKRIPVNPGEQTLLVQWGGPGGETDTVRVFLRPGETRFVSVQNWKR